MAYNGGYNTGYQGGFNANQFAGQGGFINNSPTGADSPTSESPSTKKKSGATNQSLVPVTVKQLLNATQAHAEDGFKIDGKELNQITLIGFVHKIHSLSTNVNLIVEDGTGTIEVRIWLDQEDQQDHQAQKRANWREGIYVRVIGHLRSFHNKRSIVAFRIIPVTDFNELTYHFLESIYVHLYNLKGPVQGGFVQQSSFANPYQAHQQPQPMQVSHGGNDLHHSVMQIISSCSAHDTQGASVSFYLSTISKI